MGGMTPAGLAAMLAGEDWHYVGESGEPAFTGGWANVAGFNKMAFRLREAGVVDLAGVVEGGATFPVFTLPEEYRPDNVSLLSITGEVSPGGTMSAGILYALPSGDVMGYRVPTDHNRMYIFGQFFLQSPEVA